MSFMQIVALVAVLGFSGIYLPEGGGPVAAQNQKIQEGDIRIPPPPPPPSK